MRDNRDLHIEPTGSRWSERRRSLAELLRIGTPIILGQLGIITVNFADNIMVGKYHTDALASASFVNNIFSVFFVLGMGFTYGLTPLISSSFARGDQPRLGRLLRHSSLLNLWVGGALTLALLVIYTLLGHFKLPPHLLPQVRSYFILQLISFVVFMASGALKQFFDGIGRTRVPMWIILSSNALNILGNYLLIFGELGAPELGLFGAELSTLLARIYMLIALVYVLRRSQDLRTPYRAFREQGWRTPYIQRLFRLGLPIGVQMGVEAGAWAFAILLVTPLGVDALAVHQILVTLTLLGYLVYYGLGAATTILVSRAHSTGDKRRARQTAVIALALAEGTALVVMLGLLVLRHQVGYIFSDDPAVILMTSVAVIPMALYQPGDALQVIYGNALRGMEDVKRMTLYACAIHLILAPLLSYIFGFLMGIEDAGLRLTAIWSSFPISLLLLGIFLYKRFYQITR